MQIYCKSILFRLSLEIIKVTVESETAQWTKTCTRRNTRFTENKRCVNGGK